MSFEIDTIELVIRLLNIGISLLVITLIYPLIEKKSYLTHVILAKKHIILISLIILPILFRLALDPLLRFNEILQGIDSDFFENRMLKEDFKYLDLLTIINIVLLTPIAEELVFRGYIIQSLNSNSKKIKILLSSLLFTLIHIPFNSISDINVWVPSVVGAFIIGIFLGVISIRYGLAAAIIFHIIYNLTTHVLHQYSTSYWILLNLWNFNYLYWSAFCVCSIIFTLLFKKVIRNNFY